MWAIQVDNKNVLDVSIKIKRETKQYFCSLETAQY